MCGIAGIYAYRDEAPPVDRDELIRVRDHMARRGPDGAGVWLAPDRRVGFAHRRLAIIDLSETGTQPMASADGRYVITFNGEIYNYRELRRELEAQGCAFRSQSDTEVLLHLYAQRGARMVDALRGMFAFGLYDVVERTLFLARDPFGIKPLYYADDGRTFRFASQVKALLAGGAIATTPEPAGIVGFYVMGSVPEPYTLYREIRALQAGATLLLRIGSAARSKLYYDVRQVLLEAQERPFDPAEARTMFAHEFRSAIRAHLTADVPVGLFLSGGIDSGAIGGLVVESGVRDLRAVTLGFREYEGTHDDEVPVARKLAAHYGITQDVALVTRDDFSDELPEILHSMDQPSIDGVNTYMVSRAAARIGMKVALSGLGGDELLGGYPSFLQVPRLARALAWTRRARWLGRSLRVLTRRWLGRMTSPKYSGLLEYGGTIGGAYLLRRSLFMPWELDELIDAGTMQAGLDALDLVGRLDAAREGLRSPTAGIAALELSWYMRNQLLRDTDWASMAHSLEVRVPLVDVTLFRALAPAIAASSGPTKMDFARVPCKPLPLATAKRPKTGFTTPVPAWTQSGLGRTGLRDWARQVHSAQSGSTIAPNPPARERGPRRSKRDWQEARGSGRRNTAKAWQALLTLTAYRIVNISLRVVTLLLWPRRVPNHAERVVIYRIGHIGDIVCALPAINVIRRHYPSAHLTLLTSTGHVRSPGAVELLDGVEWIDEIYCYTPQDISSLCGRWRLAMLLRRRRFDVWINLSANLSSVAREFRDIAFCKLVGPRWARGWSVDTLRFLAQAQSECLEFPGEVERALGVVAQCGFRTPAVEFGLPRIPTLEHQALAQLQLHGSKGVVAIAPGAKRSTNRWPADRFGQVGAFLAERGFGVVLLGGSTDVDECAEIAAQIGPTAVSFAGRRSLTESCAILRQCSFAICVDSGVQHLASAVGTPCISLFSFWQIRGKWHPYGRQNVVLQKWVPCHTCFLDTCPRGNLCMEEINVSDVVEAASHFLRDPAKESNRRNANFRVDGRQTPHDGETSQVSPSSGTKHRQVDAAI